VLTNAGVDAVALSFLAPFFDPGRLGVLLRCPPAAGWGEIILSVSMSVVSPETTIFGASSEIDILQNKIERKDYKNIALVVKI